MRKINWKRQYKLDNIFNIVMIIFVILTLDIEFLVVSIDDIVFEVGLGHILLVVQLMVNLSAMRFFYDNKYY